MTRKLLLLACSLTMLCTYVQASSAAEIGEGLTSQEVATLLTNKTFFVKQFNKKGNEKDYHAYFGPKGSIQVNYSERHTKSGKWRVGGKGELCFEYTKRGGSSSRRVTRCGILVKRSAFSFDRINDKGEHTATITLVANGNKFPLR